MCGERVLPGRAPTSRSTRATRSARSSPGPNGVRAVRDDDGRPAVVPGRSGGVPEVPRRRRAWCSSRTRRSTCPTRSPTPATEMSARQIYRFDEAEWHVPIAPGTDPEAAAEAGRQGAARRLPRAGRRRLLHAGREAAARIRGAGAQPRPRRGVHGARGQLRVRRRADGALRPHRGRGRTAVRVHRRARRALVPRGAPGRGLVRGGRRRDRTTSSSAAATSSTAPGSRAGGSTSACATARSPTLGRLDDDDAPRGDRRRRHDRRARHRRRAHALRPADHVRPVRDDVVLPRRHHRGRRATAASRSRRASPRTARSSRASSPGSRTWTRSR